MFTNATIVIAHPAVIKGSAADFEVKVAIATTVESANLPTAISFVELNSLTSKDAFRSSAFILAIWANFREFTSSS